MFPAFEAPPGSALLTETFLHDVTLPAPKGLSRTETNKYLSRNQRLGRDSWCSVRSAVEGSDRPAQTDHEDCPPGGGAVGARLRRWLCKRVCWGVRCVDAQVRTIEQQQ